MVKTYIMVAPVRQDGKYYLRDGSKSTKTTVLILLSLKTSFAGELDAYQSMFS